MGRRTNWRAARSLDATATHSSRAGLSGNSLRSDQTNRSKTNKSFLTSVTQSRPDHVESRASAIKWTRYIFSGLLLVLAGVLGFCVYYFFTVSENKLATEQFVSIAERAATYARQTTELKRLGVITMAAMIGNAKPDSQEWPFVFVSGYDETASRLVQTISGDGMGFAPIVEPEELEEFENFAYDLYHNTLGYNETTTAVSSFGRGVWAKDITGEFNIEAKDGKYHEGTVHPEGGTTYGSPYDIFTPVLQHSDGANAKPLMLNLHYEKKRGEAIDSIITCAKRSSSSSAEDEADTSEECGQFTDMLLLTQRKKPAGLIMQPIFPTNNASKITGIVSSPLVWQDVFDSAFGKKANGIDCVISSNTGKTYTYTVTEGEVSLVGEGDTHEAEFDDVYRATNLTEYESGLYGKDSVVFELRIYPTEIFYSSYRTNNPMWGAIISVVIISFTTIFFCLYDCNVRGEFNFKNELLEAKRSFIRFVSHEVRTPLNAVCMGLMLMREELEKSMKDSSRKSTNGKKDTENSTNPPSVSLAELTEWRGVTDEVLGNAQNAVDVLNDLLNYDKITTGSLKLELSLLESDFLMDHARKEFKLPAAKKKINIDFEDNATPPYRKKSLGIVGDDVRLIQVLRNLMSNALKFTSRGGNIKVTLSWVPKLPENPGERKSSRDKSKKGQQQALDKEQKFTLKKGQQVSFRPCGFYQLSVSDDGAGMSPDQMSNVFERGTQFNVNELQAGQGSGLGLYIAKGIMDQHNGSLTVGSEGLGKGTTFTMSIPVYHDSKMDEMDDDIESSHFSFNASKSYEVTKQETCPLRLLVVDDSDTNRKFLTRILQNHGHTCDQAIDGSEALKMVMKSMEDEDCEEKGDEMHYDAVLLDYEMPNMNGPTAAKEMRNIGSDTFIVGITGNLLPEDVEYFKSQGANEVLPKPFNISDLEELLMEYGVGFKDK